MQALQNHDSLPAAQAFRRAIELQPLMASAHYGLGLALRGLGEARQALDSMQCAVELKHDHVPALFRAGELHAELDQIEDARDCFNLALGFDPLSSAARIALAKLAAERESIDAAISILREAVDAGLADSAVYCSLAEWLTRSGRMQEAAGMYQTAIEAFPEDPGLLVNFGMLNLGHLGDAREAETLFRRALKVAPDSIEAQANLGLALHEQGRFDEALQHYAARIAAQPEIVEFRWNRGLAHLLLGNFDEGWGDYELRKQRPGAEFYRDYTFPDWEGLPLSGRTLLVYGEQGVGDEIMFASCLPQIISQAGTTIVECDARLVGLFRRSFPSARIEGRAQAQNCREKYPTVEIQSAIGSLPRYLRRSAIDFPRHRGYLMPDPARVAWWRERSDELGSGLKVGISWRGGTFKTRGPLRSIPLVECLPLFSISGVRFVSLQRSSGEEIKEIQSRHGITMTIFPGVPDDMEETAALISTLDLIISSDNTIGHLAGALGRRCWILLPFSPDWRYQWQGDSMPWYPSARLFRQRVAGDWAAVIRDVRVTLLAGDDPS